MWGSVSCTHQLCEQSNPFFLFETTRIKTAFHGCVLCISRWLKLSTASHVQKIIIKQPLRSRRILQNVKEKSEASGRGKSGNKEGSARRCVRDGVHRKKPRLFDVCGYIATLLPTSQSVDGRPAELFTRPQCLKNNLYWKLLKSLKLLIPSSALSEHNLTSPFKGGGGRREEGGGWKGR